MAKSPRLALALAAALVACKTAETEEVAAACPGAEVNVHGVGYRCAHRDDCAGLDRARECPRQFDPAGVDFCTFLCINGAQCGPGATCRRLADGLTRCVPIDCPVGAPVYRDGGVIIECHVDAGQINDAGLGRPCDEHADCADTTMPTCPREINDRAANFCTRLCEEDEDCGPGGVCYSGTSVEGGCIRYCASRPCITAIEARDGGVPECRFDLGAGR